MSHAYNFQANAYGFTDTTRKADNAASEANVAVDPTLQVNQILYIIAAKHSN